MTMGERPLRGTDVTYIPKLGYGNLSGEEKKVFGVSSAVGGGPFGDWSKGHSRAWRTTNLSIRNMEMK